MSGDVSSYSGIDRKREKERDRSRSPPQRSNQADTTYDGKPRQMSDKTLGQFELAKARGDTAAASAILANWMKKYESTDTNVMEALNTAAKAGGKRRRGGGAAEEAAARAAYASTKSAFGSFIDSTRTLVGKVVGDNMFTIGATYAAFNTSVGAAAIAKLTTFAGVASPYLISGAVGVIMVLAVYRTIRTALILTATEAGNLTDAAKQTALGTDLQALDAAAAAALRDPDPAAAAKRLFDDAKMKAAVTAALNSAGAKQLGEVVANARRVTRAAAAAEASAAAAAAAAPPGPPPAAAPAPNPVAAEELDAALNGEAGQGGPPLPRIAIPGAPPISPIAVQGQAGSGGRRLTSRRRRRAAYLPRQTRRSSSGRRRGYSRRRRE